MSPNGNSPGATNLVGSKHLDSGETPSWLAAIIESSDDAIVSKDLAGIVKSWNPAAQKIFGYLPEEMIGQSITKLIPPERLSEETAILGKICRGERVDHLETVRLKKDGTPIDVSLTISPIRDSTGKIVGASKIARDVSYKHAIEEAQRRLVAIVESSSDAIVSKDLNGIIRSWNRGAEELFGYSAEEAVGKPVYILIPDERHNEEPAILEKLKRGERIEHYETVRQRKDGTFVEVSLSVSPIVDAHGRVIGASKIARDIGAQRRIQRELEEAHEHALAASAAKDNFLAALSHELRTPLNPVLLVASENAHDPALQEKFRSDFEFIRKNVELEARLIDDLLDFSRIIKGKLPLKMSRVDMNAILRDAVGNVQPDAQAKNQVLVVEFSPKELNVIGDPVRLQQILWNILKNAVKFTGEGKRIIAALTQSDDGHAVVDISDDGFGIEPEDLEKIFDAFMQSSRNPEAYHKFGGLGLGLAIAKHIVELHGGSIRASSEGRGKGSRFIVRVPLTKHPSAVSNSVCSRSPLPAGPRRFRGKALLIEDHQPSRVTLARLLSARGFEVLSAENGEQARAHARNGGIQLIISDIGLPDIDGVTLIHEIAKTNGIPAIAVTGYGMESDVARSRDAGAVAHLTKPVTIQSLDRALDLAMNR